MILKFHYFLIFLFFLILLFPILSIALRWLQNRGSSINKQKLLVFVLIGTTYYLLPTGIIFADSGGVTLTVTISETATCGNGTIDSGEQCDGSALAGATCVSRGYTGGSLSCNSNCTFDVGNCSSATPSSGGGGGGGGGAAIVSSGTTVVFSGRAYPKSVVTLLKDAQVAASTVADPDSNFAITLSNLSAGNYIFSVYGEDKDGIRSSLFTFSVSVTAGVITNIGGIFIAPTVAVDKSEVKKGDNLAIFGQSANKSEITIMISSDEDYFLKTSADSSGVYLVNFDTTPLDYGGHNAKSKVALAGSISSFSPAVGFIVGTKNVAYVKPVKKVLKGDVNGDGRVNLVDFSIVAYWYNRTSPPAKVDLNGDGRVNLIDFSIIAYYWTG